MSRPELLAVMALAGVLNLWGLSRNGWANTYYAAAVRSMTLSWHNFLFASLDSAGVMTVDKPPLALWVQALSARIFGFNSLSLLVPQALMGVATVGLMYDLVARRFGRIGGFVAGLALALTPITVAISRHNNPDALLILCCVAALWCMVRALEHGSTRWLVGAGVMVGLAFETKMLVAMAVVPGMAVAWLWVDPAGRGRVRALGQLLTGGLAMLMVGGAWPLLVELTPAHSRPWISGTSNNTVLSLIFEYNGVGRVEGQAGGPGGNGGNMFGGTPGPLRLLNSALGGQAGWLIGFALVGGLGIVAATRLRRSDRRSGWLLAVGGAGLTTAVLFSYASGILHPYYVSLLAPFVAALVGASAAQLMAGKGHTRIVGPLAVAGGVAIELAVRGEYPSNLSWLAPVLIVVGVLAAVALLVLTAPRVRMIAVGATVAVLLIAPAVWAFDTLGHATSSTFPAGGPANLESGGPGGFGGGRGGPGRGGSAGPGGGFAGAGGAAPGVAGGAAAGAAVPGGSSAAGGQTLFGPGSPSSSATGGAQSGGSGAAPSIPGGATGAAGGPATGAGQGFPGGIGGIGGIGGAAGGGGFGAGAGSLKQVVAYVKAHGGGTIAVSSQSSAASAILEGDGNVVGIGGFSGRESDPSVSWLAQEVRAGKIHWVVDEASGGGIGGRLPGDSRAGSKAAMAAVAKECTAVTLTTGTAVSTTGAATASSGAGGGTASSGVGGETASSGSSLYDCAGKGSALESLAAREGGS